MVLDRVKLSCVNRVKSTSHLFKGGHFMGHQTIKPKEKPNEMQFFYG